MQQTNTRKRTIKMTILDVMFSPFDYLAFLSGPIILVVIIISIAAVAVFADKTVKKFEKDMMDENTQKDIKEKEDDKN